MLLRVMLLASLLRSTVAAQAPAVDWKKQEPEILRHYRSLVQIDTSSPPGNETNAVNYLKTVLEGEGIPVKVFAMQPRSRQSRCPAEGEW